MVYFKVLKFCEFCGFDRFVKFKFSKQLTKNYNIKYTAFNLVALDHMSFSGWPFVKIKSGKTENEAFANLKKPTTYMIAH